MQECRDRPLVVCTTRDLAQQRGGESVRVGTQTKVGGGEGQKVKTSDGVVSKRRKNWRRRAQALAARHRAQSELHEA